MADVIFEDVDKVYENGVQAVFGLSLDVRDGEFLVLVGPSGCGKTTALRMVAGLEDISDGTVSIGGRVVNDLSPKERDIAMVFQNYALYPHLSVAENIAFGLRLRKEKKTVIDERVQWAAKMLDLTPYLARRPKELSGGQRQRVAMGRAIVRQPQVFLMDEPLSNLDAKLRVQMRADIARLQRDLGTTTIYVTHDQVEAMTMGDRVAVMSLGVPAAGRHPAAAVRPPGQPLRRGLHRHAADEPARGTLVQENGSAALQLAGTTLPLPDAALRRYPGARGQSGRAVVVGVRPGDLHPGAVRPELPSLPGRLELIEALGTESIAYFRVEAHAVRAGAGGIEDADAEPVEGETPAEAESTGEGVTGARPNLVASFPPREALALRLGDEVPVAIDVAEVHLFDAAYW